MNDRHNEALEGLMIAPDPSGAGMTVVMYLYGIGFEAGDFGYASAVGWGIVLILSAILLLQYRLLRGLFR